MDDSTGETVVPKGARRFCREQGLAVSTFSLWRKKLSGEESAETHPLAVTPGAAFIVTHPDAAPVTPTQSLALDASSSRDRVTLPLADVRIERTGAHAERNVASRLSNSTPGSRALRSRRASRFAPSL